MDLNPLTIFPAEVWQMIINGLLEDNPMEGSKDVLNLIHAFPLFGTKFPSQKEYCLTLQALPLLRANAFFRNQIRMIQCRVINKRWCRAVDGFLNSPLSEVVYNHYYERKELPSGIKFGEREGKTVAQFMKTTENHPASRNPFIGSRRKITIMAAPRLLNRERNGEHNPRYWDADAEAQGKHMEDILKMLDKYGKHLWNFSFEYDSSFFDVQRQTLLWANLEKMFQLLPNLKCFRLRNTSERLLGGPLRKPEENVFQKYMGSPLPDLPRLEELTVAFGVYKTYQTEVNLCTRLLYRYALQLKKLELTPIGHWRDNEVFKFLDISPASVSFPELKALVCKEELFTDFETESTSYLVNHILSISAPKLEMIELEQGVRHVNYEYQPDKQWKQLLQKLKRFPVLKRFKTYLGIFGDTGLSPEEDSLLALTYFFVHDYEVSSYKMLLCFPNLERLEIQNGHDDFFRSDRNVRMMESTRRAVRTGRFFRNNIWEWLPKLETFHFACIETDITFRRDEYEQMKKKKTNIAEEDQHSWNVCLIIKYISDRVFV